MKQSAFALLIFAAAVGSTAPALSDELKPFQGLYVGLHGGYAWQNVSGQFDSTGSATSLAPLDNDGAIVGGQLGYNVQYDWFMMGVEADASSTVGSNGPVVNNPQAATAANLRTDISYLATVRGRLGVVVNDVLLFGTAGVGFGRFRFEEDVASTAFHNTLRDTDTVGVYGGGVEWKLAYGVSVRSEYLHYGFGPSSVIPTSSFFNAKSGDVVNFHDIDVVRAGLNISLGQ